MFKKSIRNRLIILLLLATILPYGTSMIVTYIHTKESLENRVVQENINLLYQGKVNLESYINELNGLTLSLYNNPDFMNYMRSPNQENNYETVGIVKNVLQTILYAEENIERVNITFAEGGRVISASKQSTVVFTNTKESINKDYYLKAKDSPFNLYVEPMHVQYEDSLKQPKNIIAIHRSLTNIPSNEVLAYISLEVLPDRIYKLSRNLYNNLTEEFFILSSDGEVIYSSNRIASKRENMQLWIEKILHSDSESGTIEWKKDTFNGVMMYNQIPESAGGWILVKRVPYDTLYESAINVTKINFMFGVIGLMLVILATTFVTFKITSPIRILLQNIQQVEEGNMKVQFESLGNDEIGILGDRFKQMIEKINLFINREYKLELENKTNQLKVLQSQINPHFLYNALQSIGTVALKNNVPQIYTLVTHLSKIMRYGMNMKDNMVPLIKEINYTKAFLLLQKERFGENLEYSIEAEEEIQNVFVPKMILQPIIENYFKHGFDIRDGLGKITMECKREGGYLVINVIDNGVGVTETRLKEIQQHFEDEDSTREGIATNIGLKNVYVRLKLYYENLATLQLENQEGGFLVKIRLPLSEEGGKNESHYN
ncbi:sensor histidine kinase [Bacillus sp. DJP31]|uniref:sensor histidine kinase n=1 Tax=Bacillus sp. DJP31 TaxID=3409789 RepID=UPI003BB74313